MNANPGEEVVVRNAELHDIQAIIELVRNDEFAREHSREALHKLFTYDWMPEKPNLGCVLTHGGRLIGFVGMIYSNRRIQGRSHRMCNLSTLCLHPDYQGRKRRTAGGGPLYSHLLAKVALAAADLTFTAFSASRAAGRLVESFGFERINNRKLVFRPGANLSTLFSGRARILDDPDQILPLLDDDHRAILRDHLPYPCGHYVVLEGGRYSYIVTKRYRVRRSTVLGDWPVERIRKGYFLGSDVLYISDPALALRHWERLKWRIIRRERTVALLADEWMLGPDAPGGVAIPRTVYVRGRKVEPQYIDKLYSELVILPH
jgi:N-acetylglutamate synthase-like GNAT family acetyltransferase